MSRKKRKQHVVVSLYPSKEIADSFKEALTDATLVKLVKTFELIKNPFELEWLLNTLEKDKLSELLSKFPEGYRGSSLDIEWLRIDNFAPVLSLFSATNLSTDDDDSAYNTSEEHTKAFELGRSEGMRAKQIQLKMNAFGIKLIPREFASPQSAINALHQEFEATRKIDPFIELDAEFQSMWDSFGFPKEEKSSRINRRPVNPQAIASIHRVWQTLISRFETAWLERAKDQSDNQKLEDDSSSSFERVIAIETDRLFGHLIGDVNFIAGLEILEPGRKASVKDFVRGTPKTLQDLVGLPDMPNFGDGTQDHAVKLVEAFRRAGGSESGIFRLLLISQISDELKTAELLLSLSPLMPSSIRSRFIEAKRTSQHQDEELLTWEIALALLCFTDAKLESWWSEGVEMHKICTDFMRQSHLNCKPLADEDFMSEAMNLWMDCGRESFWKDDEIWVEVFRWQQHITASRISRGINPWMMDEIDGISNPGMFIMGDIPPDSIFACGLWCAVEMMELARRTKWDADNFWDCLALTIKRLDSEGYSRLGFKLFHACLWRQSLLKVLNRNIEEIENRHAPLGSWPKLKAVFDLVSSPAHREILHQTCLLFARWFEDKNLSFAGNQLLDLSGAIRPSVAPANEESNIVDFSTALKTKAVDAVMPSTKSRIIELMGEKGWSSLTDDLRRQLIGMERNYESSQSERTLAGPTVSWIVDYAKLFESRILRLFKSIWQEPKYLKELSEAYAHVKPNAQLPERLALRPCLDVLIGAADLGQAQILKSLSDAGADPHSLGKKWAREIIKNVSIVRNKAAHTNEALTDVEIDRFRQWVYKNLPEFIKDIGG